MFDHIGTDPDEEGRRRRAVATAWTALGLGGVLGFVMGAVALVATEPSRVLPTTEAPVVLLEPDEPDDALPGPPDLPPLPASGGGATDDTAPPPPDVPPEDVAPLDDVVPDKIVDSGAQTLALGPGDGVGPPGPPGGPPGGGGGGGGGDGLGRGGPQVHASDLRKRRSPAPEYPSAARQMALGDQKCLARVEISVDGVPTRVEVTGCPSVFHAETQSALTAWRWYPYVVDGKKSPVVTTIAVVYRLD